MKGIEKMKKIVALLLCLFMFAVCAVAETAETKTFQLGNSPYTIEIDRSFGEGERSEDDIADDMVAYMFSPRTLLDFDVYQFNKEGYPEVLADFTAQEADEYEASEIVTDAEINGIAVAWYRAVEPYDDAHYNTLTYIIENGDEYIEVAFWLDGDNAEEQAQAIINTLSMSR